MNTDEFFKGLGSVCMEPCKLLGPIRLFDNDGQVYCPITALYKHVTGRRVEVWDWHIAASFLDLRKGIACKLMSASDKTSKNLKMNSLKTYRKRLIATLGLKEE